jgi:hypothetical protein
MKFSEAILKGYEKVNGRQCRGNYARLDRDGNPVAHCVIGAMYSGDPGDAHMHERGRFEEAWGFSAMGLNDEERMPWEHIYGMARAAGL